MAEREQQGITTAWPAWSTSVGNTNSRIHRPIQQLGALLCPEIPAIQRLVNLPGSSPGIRPSMAISRRESASCQSDLHATFYAVSPFETAHLRCPWRIQFACKSLSSDRNCRFFGTLLAASTLARPRDGWHSGEMVQRRRSRAELTRAADFSDFLPPADLTPSRMLKNRCSGNKTP